MTLLDEDARVPENSVVEVSMVAWGTNKGVSFFSRTVVFPIRFLAPGGSCQPGFDFEKSCKSKNQFFDEIPYPCQLSP